jgi:hypothetical protein
MGLLNKHNVHWTTPVLLIAMAALGAGCVLFSSGTQEKPLAFSHAIHSKEAVECADCHAGAADTDEPGMPVQSQCMLCHQGIDAQKPPEKQIKNLFVDGKLAAAHATKLGPEVVYSHAKHVAAGQACDACHTGIESNARIEPDMHISMDKCVECHASKGTSNECATCHKEIRKDTPPSTHAHTWTKMHGQSVRWPTGDLNDRCSLCHTESTCTTCHSETAPQNHNNFWRIKGHGIAAEMDRAGCAVCHRPDTCSRCHADTLPQSHTGSWGAPRDTHCLTCHFPLSANGCSICHTSTPSHASATPMPSWHNPGMNCRQCHGVTQPLPHVDDGSSCTMCHH